MEKKKVIQYLLFSCINIIPALIMGGGLTMDSLLLLGVLLVLIVNHFTLVRMVSTLNQSMSGKAGASNPLTTIFGMFFLKFAVIGAAIAAVYYLNKNLIPKVLLMMIFQLIIQVLSIKNSNKNS
jgi:hypothetical protein